jgi:hypothetical protein
MRGKQVKLVRSVVSKENPFVLLKLIEVYGSKTKEMNMRQVYQSVKKLVKNYKVDLKDLVNRAEKEKSVNANSNS